MRTVLPPRPLYTFVAQVISHTSSLLSL